MNTKILACATIRDEIEKAASEVTCDYPVIWIESGLHVRPESLRDRIQEELNKVEHTDRILMGFGYCGNAVVGLNSRDFEIVIPKVDDCISLLLGSEENRHNCSASGAIYFLTRGWLHGEYNIMAEYRMFQERYGQEAANLIFEQMLGHYKFLGIIDTGAYDLELIAPSVSEIASTFNMQTVVLRGRDHYLKKLLTGPWRENKFLIIPPNTVIEHFHVGPYSGPASKAPQVTGRIGH